MTCQHQWEMANVRFGFIVFEKCFHCNGLRTSFTIGDHPLLGDKYREGDCFWAVMENAQSFQFDLKCRKCQQLQKFDELMGFFYCTGCLPDCEVEILQSILRAEKTWLVVAFGFLPQAKTQPISQAKLDILTDYFNQRRDTSRSRVRVVPLNLIADLSRCRGEFIHDVGMLSAEVPGERKSLF